MFQKTGFLKRSGENKPKEKYLLLFLVAFFGMLLAFIPTMFTNDGIFLYYGDFNSQQVMFYDHVNDMVRNGNMGWDWGTDLGASFIGSYAFYILGSPFFWLSTIFPIKAVPFLLPWLLSLKTAVAAITAYAYIRRFVENRDACFIGGMLYAFSGFQVYNVFFNHFHDATAFFPLLLLGFELVVQDHKKGAFAIPVAICATISYFFFACEIVFLVIYFLVRLISKEFKMSWKVFWMLAIESIIGVMISAIILLPACLDVLNNPRLDQHLYGIDMVVYGENIRIPRIIQAFFMVSDMPARINIFQSERARWASLAGYLPLFSMCGVIAFMRTRKKNWATRIITVCIIMAFIPILNSSFMLFNGAYYTRWFYMPILIMCLMTAKMAGEDIENLKKGFILTAAGGLFFIAIGMLPKKENDKLVFWKIAKYEEFYWLQALLTVFFLLALGVIVYFLVKSKWRMQILTVATSIACIICMFGCVQYGVSQGDYIHYKYITNGINGKENLDMEKLDAKYSGSDNNFYRIDTSPDVDNWCMYWDLSSMRTFHSVVPASIMEFYQAIGQTRDVASRMEPKLYPLRSLFSVRYYFKQLSNEEYDSTTPLTPSETVDSLEGFKYVDTQNGFHIYENENWIPMGFAYDKYVPNDRIKEAEEVDKTQILIEALGLDNEQIRKYSSVLEKYDTNHVRDKNTFAEACKQRKAESCYYFKESSDGFDAKIKLDSDKLVFFSVPYDKGWTATVNGAETQIERVSFGFMAVLCHAGDNEIRFDFQTQGLTTGKILTVVGVLGFIAYVGPEFYKRRKRLAAQEASLSKIPANKRKK